jgi:hypothetical protein
MSQYDTKSLHEFLLHTPEGGLRKMLIDKVKMTDVHFNLLMKVVRGCNAEQFSEHFDKKDFPKLRMGPAESKLKEKFWGDCEVVFNERGILQPAMPSKVAA